LTLRGLLERQPQKISRGAFSIELPENFQREYNDLYIACSGSNAYVWVDCKPLADDSMEAPAFAQQYFDALPEEYDGQLHTLADGTVCLTYAAAIDGADYRYCDAFYTGGNYGWIVQFLCKEESWNQLWPDFQAWAQTVDISE